MGMALAPRDPLAMAVHAIDPMTCLCEHELIDAVVTGLAHETVCVIAIVAGHDGLVEDGLMADAAAVGAV